MMDERHIIGAMKAGLPAFGDDQYWQAVEKFAEEVRAIERERAIAYFLKVAEQTEDKAPLGKAHWSKMAAVALRNGWHDN